MICRHNEASITATFKDDSFLLQSHCLVNRSKFYFVGWTSWRNGKTPIVYSFLVWLLFRNNNFNRKSMIWKTTIKHGFNFMAIVIKNLPFLSSLLTLQYVYKHLVHSIQFLQALNATDWKLDATLSMNIPTTHTKYWLSLIFAFWLKWIEIWREQKPKFKKKKLNQNCKTCAHCLVTVNKQWITSNWLTFKMHLTSNSIRSKRIFNKNHTQKHTHESQ